MTEPHPVERAADDLLLLVDRIETADVPLPEFQQIGHVMSAYVDEAMPAITTYLRRAHDKIRRRDVEFGFTTAVDALSLAAGAHAVLSQRLLTWSSKRTGLSHAEVLREVLAHTDVDPEG